MCSFRAASLASVFLTIVLAACATVDNDSVTRAEKTNEQSPIAEAMPEKMRAFLIEAVDARRMDREEGRLAAERATTPGLRSYGAYMVSEQTELLAQVEALATARGINVPASIGKTKSDALADLKEQSGEKFDRQFMSMIAIDHKRDVGEFREAGKFPDAALAAFASRELPRIQSHLDQIDALKKDYGTTH